ncbi:MAG: hypothetical protein FWG71_00890 [Synergistaceae bacterium]|nr:hypothetical protein [Synergistaceae bacterium]
MEHGTLKGNIAQVQVITCQYEESRISAFYEITDKNSVSDIADIAIKQAKQQHHEFFEIRNQHGKALMSGERIVGEWWLDFYITPKEIEQFWI